MNKKARESEMVDALARQIRLLKAYVFKAQTDPDYWGEVASKLRLLVVERPRNKALLLNVAESYKALLTLEVEDLLDQPMLTTGGDSITFRDVICRWAEQLGGAHEDWAVDEMLMDTQDSVWVGRPDGGRVSLGHSNMTAIALGVIDSATQLLDGIGRCDARPTDEENAETPAVRARRANKGGA